MSLEELKDKEILHVQNIKNKELNQEYFANQIENSYKNSNRSSKQFKLKLNIKSESEAIKKENEQLQKAGKANFILENELIFIEHIEKTEKEL